MVLRSLPTSSLLHQKSYLESVDRTNSRKQLSFYLFIQHGLILQARKPRSVPIRRPAIARVCHLTFLLARWLPYCCQLWPDFPEAVSANFA